MFACPLFREFNKAAKLKGVNIDTVPTLIGITRVGIVRLEFGKIKGAKIILHAKLPTFRAAKLKGFTVFSKSLPSSVLTLTAGQQEGFKKCASPMFTAEIRAQDS